MERGLSRPQRVDGRVRVELSPILHDLRLRLEGTRRRSGVRAVGEMLRTRRSALQGDGMIRYPSLRKGAADDFQGAVVTTDRTRHRPHGGGVTDSAHSNRFQVLSLGKQAQPDGLAGMTAISEAQPDGLAELSAKPTARQTVWLECRPCRRASQTVWLECRPRQRPAKRSGWGAGHV